MERVAREGLRNDPVDRLPNEGGEDEQKSPPCDRAVESRRGQCGERDNAPIVTRSPPRCRAVLTLCSCAFAVLPDLRPLHSRLCRSRDHTLGSGKWVSRGGEFRQARVMQ